MRLPLAAACAVLALTAAGAGRAAEAEKVPANRMDLNMVGLPIVSRGRLVNYVFVTVRLNLPAARNGDDLLAKEPYLREALVRLAHRTPFGDPSGDLDRVDERALDAAFLSEARRITGPGWVTSIAVVSQQPRRRLPRPSGPNPSGRPITP